MLRSGLETVLVLIDIDLLDLIDRLLNSRHFLVSFQCRQAASTRAIARGPVQFSVHAARKAAISCSLVCGPRLTRIAERAISRRIAHGFEHVARTDLARRARRTRAHRDARKIEPDDERFGELPGSAMHDVLAMRCALLPTISAAGVIRINFGFE